MNGFKFSHSAGHPNNQVNPLHLLQIQADHSLVKVTHFSGELALGGPELIQQSSDNVYRPEWLPLAHLLELPLLPEAVKEWIVIKFL